MLNKLIKSAATTFAAAAMVVTSMGIDTAEARNNEGHNFGRLAGGKKEAKTAGGYKPGDKGPPGTGGTMITPHKDRPTSLDVDRWRGDVAGGYFKGSFTAWRDQTQNKTHPTYGDDGKHADKVQPNYGDDGKFADKVQPNYGDDGRRVSGTVKATLSDMWSGRVSDGDKSHTGKRSAQLDRILSGRASPGLY